MKKLIVVLTVFYCALLLNINVQDNINGVISEEIIQSEQELLFQKQIEEGIEYFGKVYIHNEHGNKPNKGIVKATKGVTRVIIRNQPMTAKMILV
ncbi:hypothetical protein [Mycoplasma sp. P36-A1]|uniref:hypothetical protein n=1 Tax=Mycoplasma sp. P36-A1 TaxID=3252900 RepID=UPI003C2EF87F